MKTQIFKTYSDFINREDKELNGVSPEFAESNPKYEAQNESNKGCWGCRGCSYCSYCSDCSGCSGCSYCSDCSYCRGCSYCSDCSGCSYCSDCSGCSGCSGCSYCRDCSYCRGCSDCRGLKNSKDNKEGAPLKIPVIQNIHQKVLEAIQHNGNKLDMSTWHTCDTTHCRAGWVEIIAGPEGMDLAKQTSTAFAAMQIYKASSPIRVSPARFYENDKTAMKDIIRCAEEESKL